MNIQNMLSRFRPVFAPDGTATASDGGAAAAVDQIIGGQGGSQETEPAEGDDTPDLDLDLGLDPTGEGEAEPEWEDVDLDDDMKVRAPKGKSQAVRDAYLRMADYTKKTQAIAERERAFEARESQAKVVGEYDSKLSEGVYHLKEMDKALQAEVQFFNSPEWNQLQNDDPVEAQKRWNRFSLNKDTRANLAGALSALANERNSKLAEATKAAEAEASKRREQLPREIAKLVPGWNADMAAKVEDFATRELGYEPDALKSSTEPRHFQTLHYAMVGKKYLDAMARKGSGATTPKTAPATRTVQGRGGGGQPNLDKMSPEDYAKFRRQQTKGARA